MLLRDLHSDVIGTTEVGTGLVASTHAYTPWGETRGTYASEFSSPTEIGFQGDPTHAETGLVDMGTRFYLPAIGRFSTRDVLLGELASPVSLNQFAYAGLNPVTMSDPTGMAGCDPNESVCRSKRAPDSRGRYVYLAGWYAANNPWGWDCLYGDTCHVSLAQRIYAGMEMAFFAGVAVYVGAAFAAGEATAGAAAAVTAGGELAACEEGPCQDAGAVGADVAAVGERAAAAADDVAVIGRRADTLVAQDWAGHEVLNLSPSEWSIARNDQWVASVVERKMDVYVGTNPTWGNVWDATNARQTVFGRELQQFTDVGYSWDGWYLRAPGGS